MACKGITRDGEPCSANPKPGQDYCRAHDPNKKRCTAKRPRDGKPCDADPIRGGTVCIAHGGKARQVREKAQRNVDDAKFQERLTRELARLDVEPVSDPLTALSELAGQAVAFKDAIADRVNALTAIRYEDMKGGEQLRSEVAVWERALDRCERFVTSMAKLDIDSRLARVSEQQAEAVLRAIDAAFAAAGLRGEEATKARKVAAQHLRAV